MMIKLITEMMRNQVWRVRIISIFTLVDNHLNIASVLSALSLKIIPVKSNLSNTYFC